MAVAPGSIAEELELEPGDVLLTIDGEELEEGRGRLCTVVFSIPAEEVL